MAWSNEYHLKHNQLYKARQKLELAQRRHDMGVCPRSGLDPVSYLSQLTDRVDRLETELATLEPTNT